MRHKLTMRRAAVLALASLTLLGAGLATPTSSSAASIGLSPGKTCAPVATKGWFFGQAGTLCVVYPAPAGYTGYGYLPSICSNPFPGQPHAYCVGAPTVDAYQWNGSAWVAQKLVAGNYVYLSPYAKGWSYVYSWGSSGSVGGAWAGWFVVETSRTASARFIAD